MTTENLSVIILTVPRWCGSMAEQLICNQQVDGSTPFTSSSLYGGIPERPKGADCKSVVTDFAGPNPASPTITRNRPLWSVFLLCREVHSSKQYLPFGKCAGPHACHRASSSLVSARQKHLRYANIQLRFSTPTLVVGFLFFKCHFQGILIHCN